MLPPAPPMFSTTSGWPSAACIGSAISLASASTGPPAGNGTMTTMGLVG